MLSLKALYEKSYNNVKDVVIANLGSGADKNPHKSVCFVVKIFHFRSE